MNSIYEFTLKEGPKVKIENFWWTKSWRNFLEGLKRKSYIFIRPKTYLTLYSFMKKITYWKYFVGGNINDKKGKNKWVHGNILIFLPPNTLMWG